MRISLKNSKRKPNISLINYCKKLKIVDQHEVNEANSLTFGVKIKVRIILKFIQHPLKYSILKENMREDHPVSTPF